MEYTVSRPCCEFMYTAGHCVVSRWEALERARSLKLDLVEVYFPFNRKLISRSWPGYDCSNKRKTTW